MNLEKFIRRGVGFRLINFLLGLNLLLTPLYFVKKTHKFALLLQVAILTLLGGTLFLFNFKHLSERIKLLICEIKGKEEEWIAKEAKQLQEITKAKEQLAALNERVLELAEERSSLERKLQEYKELIKEKNKIEKEIMALVTEESSEGSAVGKKISVDEMQYNMLLAEKEEMQNMILEYQRVLQVKEQENLSLIENQQASYRYFEEYLEKKIVEMTALYEITNALGTTETMDIDKILDLIMDTVARVIVNHQCFLLLADDKTGELTIKVARGVNNEIAKNIRFKFGEGISGQSAKEKKPLLVSNVQNDPRFVAIVPGDLIKSQISVPLMIEGKVIGVMSITRTSEGDFTSDDLMLCSTLANEAAMAIHRARLYKFMEELATTDGLTGLYNHRYFQQHLDKEMKKADEWKLPLSLIIIDIDHFKNFNDTHGHPMGDKVLKGVSTILKDKVRKKDMPARYGGEEFVIILPETDEVEAAQIAEVIRSAVEEYPFEGREKQPKGKLTISMGVATYPSDAASKKELIENADASLYEAKQTGKNKVVVASSRRS